MKYRAQHVYAIRQDQIDWFINEAFSKKGGDVICAIAGHTHTDCILNT